MEMEKKQQERIIMNVMGTKRLKKGQVLGPLLLTNEVAKCNALICSERHCSFTSYTNIIKAYNHVPLEKRKVQLKFPTYEDSTLFGTQQTGGQIRKNLY